LKGPILFFPIQNAELFALDLTVENMWNCMFSTNLAGRKRPPNMKGSGGNSHLVKWPVSHLKWNDPSWKNPFSYLLFHFDLRKTGQNVLYTLDLSDVYPINKRMFICCLLLNVYHFRIWRHWSKILGKWYQNENWSD
jgi:hypothetical protein